MNQQDTRIMVVSPLQLIDMYFESLARKHWDEVPFGDFGLDIEPNIDTYRTMYEAGMCRAYVALNEEDTVVAYLIVFVSEMVHHKGVYQMTTDLFYVDPAYRRCGLFVEMMDKAEAECLEHGIRFMSYAINPTYSDSYELESWLLTKDFQCTEKVYTREVK